MRTPRRRRRRAASAGFTIAELIVGLAVMAVVGVVVARLFLAMLSTAQYTLRHLATLSSARKAYVGDGQRRGMSWGVQEASGLVSLSTSSVSAWLTRGSAGLRS